MKLFLALLAFLCLAPLAALANSDPDPMAFARGLTLETDGTAAVYRVILPEEVYRTVLRADLGDLRVFNQDGEMVPHSLARQQQEIGQHLPDRPIPFFPLHQDHTQRSEEDLSLQITRGSDGTIIAVGTRDQTKNSEKTLSGYLLDLSGFEQPVQELELHWPENGEPFVTTASVHDSDDLTSWRELIPRRTLAELRYGENTIRQQTLPLPRPPGRYLRLSWQDGPLPLVAANGRFLPQSINRPRHHTVLEARFVEEDEKEVRLHYDAAARLPVETLNLEFAEDNSMLRARVLSRSDHKSGWLPRGAALFHDLRFDGTTLKNADLPLPPVSDPSWQLAIDRQGLGIALAKKPPRLVLGWLPHELLFVARGTPPFLLAFGNGHLQQDAAAPSDLILQALADEHSRAMVGQATMGAPVELGGSAALQPPPAPLPWKKWLLWAILFAGLLLLGIMLGKLNRQLNR